MGNPYAPPGPGGNEGDPPADPPRNGSPREGPPREGPPSAGRPPAGPSAGRPPPRARRPADPEAARRASRLVGRFALLVIAALLVSRLRLPWSAAAPAFTVAGLVVGVLALVQGIRAGVRGGVHVLIGVGLGMGFVVLIQQLLVVALWPVSMQLQQCRDAALTLSAEQACQQQYEQRIRDLTRLPTPSP